MINETMVSQVAAFYKAHMSEPTVVEGLKRTFPGVHFTVCDDDDVVGAKPVYTEEGLNVYLVGGDHCLGLTCEMEGASGMVLAECHEDDD